MPKNIVVCCDGTGNEFGDSNSNVVDLYKTLICDEGQVTYYHPGVGTMGSRSALSRIGRWWTKVVGLAFGYGLSDNIADAYQFLMRNFEPGDHVYVFGFSRGAYTARALCGMLHAVGLLTLGNEGLIPYAIRMIKKKHIDFPVLADFKKTFAHPVCHECKGWCAHDCRPYFVGVWDTVSSVGWVYNAVTFPFTRATKNPDWHIMRHAVSIDERRAFFPSNAFGDPNNQDQDLKEVLFAGVHSDVGGSYPEAQSQLSKITLRWMLIEAQAAGLCVNQPRMTEILGANPHYVAPDPLTRNQHKSLHGVWWIAELWPKIVSVQNKKGEWKKRIRINLGRRRKFAPNPVVHESVVERLKGINFPYHPSNLLEPYTTVGDGKVDRAAAQSV